MFLHLDQYFRARYSERRCFILYLESQMCLLKAGCLLSLFIMNAVCTFISEIPYNLNMFFLHHDL